MHTRTREIAHDTAESSQRRAHDHDLADREMIDRRLAIVGAILVPVVWAVIAVSWMPRGPLTTFQALASMVIGCAVGVAAGRLLASRWAMVVAPAAFVLVFEALRIGLDGPTVDAPAFSQLGLIALAVGRGFHGLVGLAPMVLGAALGAGMARRARSAGPATGATMARRFVAATVAVCLVAVAVLIARPASTAPIVGADGQPLPNSIAELTTVDVAGIEQGIMIRGHDLANPVLLFLAGGPGGTERGAMRNHLPELEEHFVVATWDQRGTGSSYAALDPTDTVTLDGSVDDAIAVTEYLLDRFGRDELYLLGQSWGTTLGVLAIQERPDLFAAYVGTGQMVSQRETDSVFYHDAVASARDTGQTDLVEHLTSIGEPPWDDMLSYEIVLSNPDLYPYDHSANSEGAGAFSENLMVPEYSLVDQVHSLGAMMDTFAALYPQLQDIDFRETAVRFDVPMFFVQGRHEAPGRSTLFEEWYDMIEAPHKEVRVLETSGHRPLFEQPGQFVDVMTGVVLEQTEGSRS